jgi:hypothetical protein
MYFLKFVKWFWMEHLDDEVSRFFVGAAVWATLFVMLLCISVLLNSWVIFQSFLIISLTAFVVVPIFMSIHYLYKTYRLWESRVFAKLKE